MRKKLLHLRPCTIAVVHFINCMVLRSVFWYIHGMHAGEIETYSLCLVTKLGFHLIGCVNSHNNICWPAENTIFICIMLWHGIWVCAYCAVSVFRIIGLVFCKIINYYSWHTFWHHVLTPVLLWEKICIFQKASVTGHTSTKSYVCCWQYFGDRIICMGL